MGDTPAISERAVRERMAEAALDLDHEFEQREQRRLVRRVGDVGREWVDFATNPQGRIPLGYANLDAAMRGGIAPGELAVLAAGAYTGKTTFLANVAVNNPSIPMLFASIEMTLPLVAARLYAMTFGEEYSRLEERVKGGDRALPNRMIHDLQKELPRLGLMGVGGPSVETLRRGLEDFEYLLAEAPGLLMVDYLDLMAPNSENVESVKRKLVQLRELGKEANLGVLVAHQLKREVLDQRAGQPLRFTDTRYAGEAEGDFLVGMYRRVNDPDVQLSRRLWEQYRWTIHWQLLKNRSGEAVGVEEGLELGFNPETLRITERPEGPWRDPSPAGRAVDAYRQTTIFPAGGDEPT